MGIEVVTDPLCELGVALVLWIGNRFEHFGVAPRAATRGGRPATGQDPTTSIRLSAELLMRIDGWAAQHPDKPTRIEAIRLLIELGLKVLWY